MKVNVKELLSGIKSPNTVVDYTYQWDQYVRFAGSERKVYRAETLASYRQHMVNNTKLSRSSINKAVYAVRAVIEALYEQQKIGQEVIWEFREVSALPGNALMDRRRQNTRVRITAEQMRDLIRAVEDEPCPIVRAYHKAFLLTLATSGMRITECVRIRFSEVRKEEDVALVTNVIGKAKGEPRDVPISCETYDALMQWKAIRPNNSDYVFNLTGYGDGIAYSDGPVHRVTASDIIQRYTKKMGLEGVHAHSFRRFVGTQLVQKKGIRAAQQQLGHANIATTARFYDLNGIDARAVNDLF